jgi:hypothetical protein
LSIFNHTARQDNASIWAEATVCLLAVEGVEIYEGGDMMFASDRRLYY